MTAPTRWTMMRWSASARRVGVLDRRVAAGEPRPHAVLEVLAERGMELADPLDRGPNAPGHRQPHAVRIGRCPACAATETGGGAQLVAELLEFAARDGSTPGIVAAFGVLELRAQLGKAPTIVGSSTV